MSASGGFVWWTLFVQRLRESVSDWMKWNGPAVENAVAHGQELTGDLLPGVVLLDQVAASGRQVAFLVPTTVLCQQHLSTLRERFADTPVIIVTSLVELNSCVRR